MKKFLLIISIFYLFVMNVHAEEFTQASRFTYYTYYNTDTMRDSGTGLINEYYGSNNKINRIQWLYQLYTFDSNYLYDITLTTYYEKNDSNTPDWIISFGNTCQIYTGTGPQYQCYLNSGRQNDFDYVEMTILNMQGTNSNTLWMNLYSNANKQAYISQLRYSLQITKKEDNKATSDDIYNASQTIINNQNQNNNALRSDINAGVDHILDSQSEINDNITDDSLPSTANWLDSWTNLLLENNSINQLLYIPVNILTKVRTGLSGNCTNISIPFGITGGNETLTFQCWKVTDYIGNNVGELITGLVGFYLIYYFALFLWKFYDHFTSMRDTLALIMGNEDTLIVKGDE